MRKPMAIIGFVWILMQWISVVTGHRYALAASAGFAAVGIVFFLLPFLRRQKEILLAIWVAVGSLLVCGIVSVRTIQPVRELDGETVRMSGVLLEEPEETNGGSEIVLMVEEIFRIAEDQNANGGFRVRLVSSSPLDAKAYDRVQMESVRLYAPEDGFGYTAAASLAADRIYLCGTFSSYSTVVVGSEPVPWWVWIPETIRATMSESLFRLLPEKAAALCAAVVLGETAGLSETVKEAFRVCGISHLLVVSGLHLSILATGLLAVLGKILRRKRLSAVLTMFAVVLFMAMVGFTPSVVRAGITMLLYLLGIAVRRNSDPINALAFAGFAIGVGNPCAAGSIGFQLSFLATLGILVCAGPVNRWLRGKIRLRGLSGLTEVLVVSASAALFTMPVSLLVFGYVSAAGLWVNVAVALPAQGMLLGAMLTALTGCANGLLFLARPLAFVSGFLARILCLFAEWVAKSAPVLYNKNHWMTWLAVGCLLLASVGCFLPRGKGRRIVCGAGGGVLLVLCGILLAGKPGGDTIQITKENAILWRCGEETVLVLPENSSDRNGDCAKALRDDDAIDLLVLPGEYVAEAAIAAAELRAVCPVREWMLGAERVPDEFRTVGEDFAFLPCDGGVWYGERLSVRVFSGESGSWCLLEDGETRMLIQVGSAYAEEIPAEWRQCDVLVLFSAVDDMERLSAEVILVGESDAVLWRQVAGLESESYVVPESGGIALEMKNAAWRVRKD